ncbi:MAG: tetratricopeptide repeat protein [Bacteroidota bacterium]
MKPKYQFLRCRRHDYWVFKSAAVMIFMFLLNSGLTTAQVQSKQDIPKEQQKRLDLMKSRSVDGSLTILPVRLMGQPMGRVSEVVGVIFEQNGLKNIELSEKAFTHSTKISLQDLADSAGKFVKTLKITTDYVLYAEMNGDMQKHTLDELLGIVVDKSGALVWSVLLNSNDELFRNVGDPDPMGYSMLLVQLLSPQMGLSEETARTAKPGKMTDIMNARSGLPPENERAAMPDRQKIMKDKFKTSTLIVFPVRIGDDKSKQGATDLIKTLNDKGICKAVLAKDTMLLLTARQDPNEMKILWDLARDFKEYVKKNPQNTDYMLYADYGMPGYVHFVVCDKSGEWVIADLQNSDHPDFRMFDISTMNGCNQLLITRLLRYIKTSVADEIRKTMNSSGIETANAKLKEMKSNTADYNLSEDEMNALGYEYLMSKKVTEAIAVFKMNVDAFPDSWNTYDSLGEAYAAAGDKENAINNYEKSVQLNPNSPSGNEALKKLKSK